MGGTSFLGGERVRKGKMESSTGAPGIKECRDIHQVNMAGKSIPRGKPSSCKGIERRNGRGLWLWILHMGCEKDMRGGPGWGIRPDSGSTTLPLYTHTHTHTSRVRPMFSR